MYSSVSTAALHGIQSILVQVEADVRDGLPAIEMVGVLSSEVKEAKERIRSALHNIAIDLSPKKVTINLYPADVPKSGTGFDLPIALAILSAYGLIEKEALEDTVFLGELTLSGEIRPVKGILPMALVAQEASYANLVIPAENAREAAIVKNIKVLPISHLQELFSYLIKAGKAFPPLISTNTESPKNQRESGRTIDFSEINGQRVLRRACEVAAAGMHNLLMTGPPGSGKTMAARAMPTILPKLSEGESLEIAKIYSSSGRFEERKNQGDFRPFRSPHHSITGSALVGGGRVPEPGEISLAHGGVLFLDELTEYSRHVLELLRQPLEEKEIRLVRVSGTYRYPADFMLLAAMNPCHCGYYPNVEKCSCTPSTLRRYRQRISRPLLDRIDLCVEAPKLKVGELAGRQGNEDSESIRKRVEQARKIQQKRYGKECFSFNSHIPAKTLDLFCPMETGAKEILEAMYDRLDLSARTYHKMIRVARTIADLEGEEVISEIHMSEALLYRNMEGNL